MLTLHSVLTNRSIHPTRGSFLPLEVSNRPLVKWFVTVKANPMNKAKVPDEDSFTLADTVISSVFIGIFKSLDLLPYERRVVFGGWLLQNILAPLLGYRKRILSNLKYIYPEMGHAEARDLSRRVSNNFGRSLIEIFSPTELSEKAKDASVTGLGLGALEDAKAQNKPIILVSGHFGNYDVVRHFMSDRGFEVGGLYRNMKFRKFNSFYVSRISSRGGALFPRERSGMAKMIKFLKQGNVLALLIDQHMQSGVPLDFLGKPAFTALSAAELALKYDAVLFPVYSIRQDDGLSFKIKIEAPIVHTDAVKMTQELNDSLSKMVTDHKEQWFWVHKRWK